MKLDEMRRIERLEREVDRLSRALELFAKRVTGLKYTSDSDVDNWLKFTLEAIRGDAGD